MSRRLLLCAVLLSLRARAEPSLVVKTPGHGAKLVSVQLVGPKGDVVWTCAPSGADTCTAPPGWFRGPGSYAAAVSLDSQGSPVSLEHALVVAGEDIAVTWEVGDSVTHEQKPDDRITLTVPEDRLLTVNLTNRTERALSFPWRSSMEPLTVDEWKDGAWAPLKLSSGGLDGAPIAPGETRSLQLPGRERFTSGRYRVQVIVEWRVVEKDDEDESRGLNEDSRRILGWRPSSRKDDTYRMHIVSPAFDYAPGTRMLVCPEAPMKQPPNAAGRPGHWGLLQTAAGAFLKNELGDLVRVDDGSMKAVGHVPPDSFFQVWPDGKHVFASGAVWLLSADGGLTFTPLSGDAFDSQASVSFIRDRVLLLSRQGDVAWVDAKGRVTHVAVPVKTRWIFGAFRDDRNGVLLGDCSVLLETQDGGVHWTTRPAPWNFLGSVRWDGGDLVVRGGDHLFRRKAGEAGFIEEAPVVHPMAKPWKEPCASWGGHIFMPFSLPYGASATVSSVVRAAAPDGSCTNYPFRIAEPRIQMLRDAARLADGSILVLTAPNALLRVRGEKVETLVSSQEMEAYQLELQARMARSAEISARHAATHEPRDAKSDAGTPSDAGPR